MIYLLDVDGTLTPSRGEIDAEFKAWFSEFCDNNKVYLVTGSDRPKTLEQIGHDIYSKCDRVYQCNGNDVWKVDVNINTHHIEYDADLEDAMAVQVKLSKFPLRTGRHIEKRPGMINLSTVGRNATLDERLLYVAYDEEHNEREQIAEHLRNNFPKYNFQVAGDTGIDITLKGRGKETVLTDFNECDSIIFIGDRTDAGGNDHDVAKAVAARHNGRFYNVKSWEETWKILKKNE